MSRNNWKPTFFFLVQSVVGGLLGYSVFYYESNIANFLKKLQWSWLFAYDMVYVIFALLTLVSMVWTLVEWRKYRKHVESYKAAEEEEEILNTIEKKVGKMIMINAFTVMITISWLSLVLAHLLSLDAADVSEEAWVVGTLLIALFFEISASVGQIVLIRMFNRTFPNRSFNMWTYRSKEEFFQKLDEGEKWVVYRSAFRSFQWMDTLLLLGIAFFIIYSLFDDFALMPIIVLSIIWVSKNLLYFKEAGKFES
jgi:hypothetical protein